MSQFTPYVKYAKHFRTGTLAGLTVPAGLEFPTAEAARQFIDWLHSGTHSDVCTGARWNAVNVTLVTDSETESALV